MLLTVTPNLCLERTMLISGFAAGSVHRVAPDNLRLNAGGKGINAARVAAGLGCDVLATAWVGRRQHEWFEAQLAREGVPHDLVEVEADTRVSVNILDGGVEGSFAPGRSTPACKTEIVEAGNPLQESDAGRMTAKLSTLLPRASLIAVCGSYPPARSTPEGENSTLDRHLSELLALAHQHGVRTLVDGKGTSFELAVKGAHPPWCIKPNIDEAAALLSSSITNVEEETQATRDLLELGVEVVVLSCGERGAYLGTRQGVWFFESPPVPEISPVGSGDALVGAFAATYLRTGDLHEAMRWGVAAGAANAAQVLPAFCKQSEIEVLLSRVHGSLLI